MIKENASDYPSFYYARHMQPGIAGYENETILVDTDSLKEMIPTFVGKPIVVLHKDINLDNLESKDGTVIESFYNELDGWLWAKCLIETDAARQAITQGWSVSNCYLPTQSGAGGKHLNVSYDRKIVNAEFKHLAIVPNPRYENAKIYTPDQFKAYQAEQKERLTQLQNSKETKKMFKLFKNEKKEVSQIDEDTMLTLENGKDVSLKEMINAVQNAEDKKKGDEEAEKEGEEKVNMDSEVCVGESKMPIRELVNKYNAAMKKNSDAEEAERAEKAKSAKEKKEEEKEMENSVDHFSILMNAARKMDQTVVTTNSDKVQRGKDLYGTSK